MSKMLNKFDIKTIPNLCFYIGSGFVSFFGLFLVIVSALNSDSGLQVGFIFSYPNVFIVLFLIILFLNITSYKNTKIYYILNFIALITTCITLINGSLEMSNNPELFVDRMNIYHFLFRLTNIIAPSLYLIFFFIKEESYVSKKKILLIFLFPLIYVLVISFLATLGVTDSQDANFLGSDSLSGLLQNKKALFFKIVKIIFRFLPLTPCVLGLICLKEELFRNKNFHKFLLIIGCFLIVLSLGGFWYPFPFSKEIWNSVNNKDFAKKMADHHYAIHSKEMAFFQNSNSENKNYASNVSQEYCPSVIYSSSDFTKNIPNEEYNYIRQNWQSIISKNYKYQIDKTKKQIYYDKTKQKYYVQKTWY